MSTDQEKAPLFFETIKLIDGKMVNQQWHQARLSTTIAHHFASQPFSLAEVYSQCPDLGRYRLKVIYASSLISVHIQPLEIQPINSLKIVRAAINYPFKFVNRLELEDLYQRRDDADDVIILNIEGYVTDTTCANLAFWDGKRWVTPEHSLLPGTIQARMISLGVVRKEPIHESGLRQYPKVAIMNALRGIQVIGGEIRS